VTSLKQMFSRPPTIETGVGDGVRGATPAVKQKIPPGGPTGFLARRIWGLWSSPAESLLAMTEA
jgi:hypothetical protein